MHRRTAVSTLGVVVGTAFALTTVALGQSNAQIKGVWRITEQITTGPNGRTIDRSSPGVSGMIIVTDRHWSYITETGDKPRPQFGAGGAARATDAELRATWGPFDAQGGTYEVNGNEMTLRHIVAKTTTLVAPDAFLIVSFKVDGKTAVITQVRTQAGPFANPGSWKVTRIE